LIRVTNHPPENNPRNQRLITALLEVMAALRTPGTGCPWDLEQTFATIAPYTIEEAYEVADAIDKNDLPALKEELGDLLLQVVYHARMAEERQAFAFADVVEAITAKMIRRHPHVFGTDAERAAGAAPGFWERIKAQEKLAADSKGGSPPRRAEGAHQIPREGSGVGGIGVLDDVPVGLPALTRAVKLQHKAAKVGFDWPSLAPVFAKAKEEIAELEEALADGRKPNGMASAEVTEEFGDLLFVMANVARHLEIDPEAALRAANAKFVRRFQRIESLLAANGRTPSQSTLAEMDRLWDQAKEEERQD
jgi:ATP diphosphatase